jgi:hypothetical protein
MSNKILKKQFINRLWDFQNKIMIYQETDLDGNQKTEFSKAYQYDEYWMRVIKNYIHSSAPSDQFVEEFFINCLDKNLKKIFVGDIIRVSHPINNKDIFGVDTFAILESSNIQEVFIIRSWENDKPGALFKGSVNDLLEVYKKEKYIQVVGNIHEGITENRRN